MNDAREIFSKNLLKMMKRKGIDQKELAESIGVSQSSVSQWISKSKYPRIDKIEDISNFFGVYKSDLTNDNSKVLQFPSSPYSDLTNLSVSAGLPLHIDAVTGSDKIEIPDSIMGKWARQSDIFILRVNGESMNKVIPDKSLIAVKPVELSQLKAGDIVVYSDNGEYSVKRIYKDGDNIIFRPDSHEAAFYDYITPIDNENLRIHGKVVVYIVEMD